MPRQLQMFWPETAQFPDFDVPDGYRIRPIREGDEAGQVRVMHVAGFDTWNEEKLAEWWKTRALPDGVFVVVHEASGEIVATAMASHRPSPLHPCGGELGWVAADPGHAGRGLGRVVCAGALKRFLDAGYRRLYLSTDDFRLAAIKTYLKMGFRPFLFAPDMEKRWQTVCRKLDWPIEPDTWARAPEAMWDRDSDEPYPDLARIERYAVRHRWLPNRPHRGFSGNGDVDAFGDESLYKPSRLGTVRVEPCEIQAAAESPLVLFFTAGEDGVPVGATVTFVIRGQQPLGHLPEPRITGPDHCELTVKGLSFAVKKGCLAEGDSVTLAWPSFRWTPLAGRRELKGVLNFGAGKPERRFPEPIVIDIHPGDLSRLEATLPGSHRPGEQVDLRVTARDRHDNRVPYSGTLHLSLPQDEREIVIEKGIATAPVCPAPDRPFRVIVNDESGLRLARSNPSVPVKEAQLFVGDLHGHDFLSEAEGYPDELYRWAIEDRRLDFLSVVPQSHGWHDNETWTLVKYMNERYLDEGRFVPFLGFEWQHSHYGDKVVHYLGGDQPCLPVDEPATRTPAALYEVLRGADALVIGHHSAYPRDTHVPGTDFDAVETDVERLVELWSMHGSSEGYDPADRPLKNMDPQNTVMSALKRGLRLGFTAGSDTHSGRPGGSTREPRPHWGGLTAVWADRLTRRDLFRALYERRTYALTRARIVLQVKVNGLPMGSEGEASDQARIEIDAWAPGPIARVELMKNASVLTVFEPRRDECHIQAEDKTGGEAFYHCRIVMNDGNLAVCSPIWLG